MSFEIKEATRQGIIPLVFIWGGTGGGKTESALRLARGMAGPKGRVVIGDTENGRAKICADRIPGGYKHIDFQPPFTPERYCEILDCLEQNADVAVLDSVSHLWSGPDGVLELHEQILDKMAGDDWQKREAASWRAWKEPKSRLAIFKDRILRCKIPMICCFRGEEKSQLIKDERGKSQIVQSKTTIPIFEKKLVFEAIVAFEAFQIDGKGGFIRLPMPYAKISHNSLLTALPEVEKEQIDSSHGEKLMRWCAAPGTVASNSQQPIADSPKPASKPVAKAATEATRQWFVNAMAPYGDDAVRYAQMKDIIEIGQGLADWPLDRVPTSKAALATLSAEIDEWRGA